MEKTENSGRLDFFAYNPFENYELVEKIWIAMLDKCQQLLYVLGVDIYLDQELAS